MRDKEENICNEVKITKVIRMLKRFWGNKLPAFHWCEAPIRSDPNQFDAHFTNDCSKLNRTSKEKGQSEAYILIHVKAFVNEDFSAFQIHPN